MELEIDAIWRRLDALGIETDRLRIDANRDGMVVAGELLEHRGSRARPGEHYFTFLSEPCHNFDGIPCGDHTHGFVFMASGTPVAI